MSQQNVVDHFLDNNNEWSSKIEINEAAGHHATSKLSALAPIMQHRVRRRVAQNGANMPYFEYKLKDAIYTDIVLDRNMRGNP